MLPYMPVGGNLGQVRRCASLFQALRHFRTHASDRSILPPAKTQVFWIRVDSDRHSACNGLTLFSDNSQLLQHANKHDGSEVAESDDKCHNKPVACQMLVARYWMPAASYPKAVLSI